MAVALVATAELRAGDTSPANPFFGTLSAVSPAELPAKSAELVSQANSKNLLETAAAAPSEAGKIVEAVCRVVPTAYKEVANAVAGVVPGAGKAILAGISVAIPALQEPIGKVVAGNNGGNPSVSEVLNQVSTPIPAPSFGPPYVSITPSPLIIEPSNGGQVPTGGRKYNLPSP